MEMYGYGFLLSLTGYLGLNLVLTLGKRLLVCLNILRIVFLHSPCYLVLIIHSVQISGAFAAVTVSFFFNTVVLINVYS